jgi:AcrR family transcriptional regulator
VLTTTDDTTTERRLLLAAERLFAEHGVDGVSLRAVMSEAGTNVASVHYHFGSKDGLLDAVVRSRIDTIAFSRDALVANLGEDTSHRALAAAFIQPILDLVEAGAADWVALIADLLRTNHPALAPVSDGFFERNSRFVELLRAADPAASTRAIGFRLAQAMTLTLGTLGGAENLRAVLSRDGQVWTDDELRDELLDVVASILAGPPRSTGVSRGY